MRHVQGLAVLTVAVAACGGAAARPLLGNSGGAAAARDACPAAAAVRYAELEVADAAAGPGLPTAAHWRIPLGYRFEDEQPPAAGPLAAAAVRALGMPTVPDVVWLHDGVGPACRARIRGYVAVALDHGTGESTTVSAITTDCVAEPTDAHAAARAAWVLAVTDEPTGCRFVSAATVGKVAGDDRAGTFVVPPVRAPVPAPYDRVVPRPACAPACATLWSLRAVPVEPPIAELTVSDVTVGALADMCSWPVDDAFGLYVGGEAPAAPRPLLLPRAASGEELPAMSLAGVFADGGGARVVTLRDRATWAAYDVEARATLGGGARIDYFRSHGEDYWYRSMAPYCGP